MNAIDMNEAASQYRARLVEELAAAGMLTDPAWRRAWEAVPREVFVPRFAISTPTHPGEACMTWYDGTDPGQHARWLAAAYRNEPLITRYAPNGIALSSSTEPSLMAHMLNLLDVKDGQRVLEIGTGTGYNAALLAHRLGPRHVTTIDVDPLLTQAARAALDQAGYPVIVLTGDGTHGTPEQAPFDRIVATCGVDRIPAAWIEQLTPQGAIVANVSRGLIVLRRTGEHTVSGRFCDQAGFMALHPSSEPTPPTTQEIFQVTGTAGERQNDAAGISRLDFTATSFLASLVAERSHLMFVHRAHGAAVQYRWWHPASRSWVRVELRDDGRPARIHETGPRGLWAELAPLLTAWETAGRPGIEQFGLTITPQQHALWIGLPHGPHQWTLAD